MVESDEKSFQQVISAIGHGFLALAQETSASAKAIAGLDFRVPRVRLECDRSRPTR